VFAQFGDHFSLPIFGNFDPPVVGGSGSMTNSFNALDVNNDGVISPIDALLVINQINSGKQTAHAAVSSTGPYFDVNGDKSVTPIDALMVINYLNSHPGSTGSGGEGEAIDAALATNDHSSVDVVDEDLLGILAAETNPARPRSLKAFG